MYAACFYFALIKLFVIYLLKTVFVNEDKIIIGFVC